MQWWAKKSLPAVDKYLWMTIILVSRIPLLYVLHRRDYRYKQKPSAAWRNVMYIIHCHVQWHYIVFAYKQTTY